MNSSFEISSFTYNMTSLFFIDIFINFSDFMTLGSPHILRKGEFRHRMVKAISATCCTTPSSFINGKKSVTVEHTYDACPKYR